MSPSSPPGCSATAPGRALHHRHRARHDLAAGHASAVHRATPKLGSANAIADSHQTLPCTYLSTVPLIELPSTASPCWSWTDRPTVALIIAAASGAGTAVRAGRAQRAGRAGHHPGVTSGQDYQRNGRPARSINMPDLTNAQHSSRNLGYDLHNISTHTRTHRELPISAAVGIVRCRGGLGDVGDCER
jgi:hypothetical protein